VALEALSGRLAIGPLCPAPDTSKFDAAWRQLRTDQPKQHPCQTAVHSKHAGHAVIIEGRAPGRSFVVVRRLTAKRRRFRACPTYRQSAHNLLCRAASCDPDLISLSVGTRSARRALRRVSREAWGTSPAFDGVEVRFSATTHPVKARPRSLKLRKSVDRDMPALAEARSRIANSGLSPETRRLGPEVVVGRPSPRPHDHEAGCAGSKRLLSLQPGKGRNRTHRFPANCPRTRQGERA
jgi:hypothetical protein